MIEIIEAVYENGVLKPLTKVNFKEKEKVYLIRLEDLKELLKSLIPLIETIEELERIDEIRKGLEDYKEGNYEVVKSI